MTHKREKYENDLKKYLGEDVFKHSKRVAIYSERLGKAIGLNQIEQEKLYVSGLFHDVGKQMIKSNIWHKTDNLNRNEFELVKRHPIKSYQYMLDSEDIFLQDLSDIVKHHHENFDGSGYPSGLEKLDIPLLSRIIAVCDGFDAMISKRSYRPFAYSEERALKIIRENKGIKYDPFIVESLESNFNEFIGRSKEVRNNAIHQAV